MLASVASRAAVTGRADNPPLERTAAAVYSFKVERRACAAAAAQRPYVIPFGATFPLRRRTLQDDFAMLRGDGGTLQMDFATWRGDGATLQNDFETLRESFATLQIHFVTLQIDFVTLQIHFATLQIHFVTRVIGPETRFQHSYTRHAA